MPPSKLTQALMAQQSQAAITAARKKSGMNKQAKEESLKHTVKEKRAMKKMRQARKDREAEVEKGVVTQGGDEDGMVVIDGPDRPTIALDQGMDVDEAVEAKAGKKTKSSSKSKSNGKGGKNPNQLPVVPFDRSDTILLLGEANFSFSSSLLLPPHELLPHQILATSYDTERECYLKYPDGEANVSKLREAGVKVEFKVDAGNLEKCKAVGKGRWSRVIFNFPHAGAGITDQDRNILTNQHLLLRTLRSVAAVLTTGPLIDPTNHNSKKRGHNNKAAMRGKANNKPKKEKASDNPELDLESDIEDEEFGDEVEMVDQLVGASTKYSTGAGHVFTPPHRQGSILITLLNQDPYTSWGLPSLAQRPPPSCPGTRLPQPRYRLLRSFKFHHEQYEGYAHRRTIGFKEGKSKADNEEITGRQGEARTWEFVKAPEREPKDERD